MTSVARPFMGGRELSLLEADYWSLLARQVLEITKSRSGSVELLQNMTPDDVRQIRSSLLQNDLLLWFDDNACVLLTSWPPSVVLPSSVLRQPIVGVYESGVMVVNEFSATEERTIKLKPSEVNEAELISHAVFDMLPIWHVRRNVVAAFRFVPHWNIKNGEQLWEDDLSAYLDTWQKHLALDMRTATQATNKVSDAGEPEGKPCVMLPLHFDFIEHADGFADFTSMYQRLFAGWQDRMFLELKGIPKDASYQAMRDVVQKLRPYCYGLFLQVPFAFEHIASFNQSGLISFGVDLSHETRDEGQIISDLEDFVAKASGQNVHTHVVGMKSVSLSVAAICAGFDYIGSTSIGHEHKGWSDESFLVRPIDLYKQFLRTN